MTLSLFTDRLFRRASQRPSRLEIHIPLNPTQTSFSQIHYLAASLRLNGGPLADSKIIVTLGGESEPFDPYSRLKWSKKYNLEWRWMPRSFFEEQGEVTTSLYRFRYTYESDVVLLLSPKVLVAAPFDDLIARVEQEQKIIGVPANFSPLARPGTTFTWEKLLTTAGLGDVPYVMEHSGFGVTFHEPAYAKSPPYFNLGVLPLPAGLAGKIGQTIFNDLDLATQAEDFFRTQMALTLAILRQHLPWDTASFKYNFVNDPAYLQRYRAEFDDLRLIHQLESGQTTTAIDFESPASVEIALSRNYDSEFARKFIEVVRPIHDQVKRDLR